MFNKSKILLLAFFCTISLMLNAQETAADSSLFYYYQGEKIHLQTVPDKIMVKFESGVSLERAKEELKYYQEVCDLKDDLNFTLKDLLVVNVRAGINPGRVKELLSAISNNSSVLHVSPLMVGSQENIKVATDGKIIIKLKENGREEQLIAFLKNYAESVIEKDNYNTKSYFLKFKALSTKQILQITNDLSNQEFTEFAEPNFIVFAPKMCATDPDFSKQWGLQNNGGNLNGINYTSGADMKVCNAWQYGVKGLGVRIAILDDGVASHFDLNANRLPGKDFTGLGGAGFPYTGNSHGTACAGIIAAQSNSNGITGVAPSAKFIPIRISADNDNDPCTSWVTYDLSLVAQAIRWAVDSANADVLSCSWGSPLSTSIQNAISHATANGRSGKGALVFFAAGNFSNNQVAYPSSINSVIAVGASNMCDRRKSGPLNGYTNNCQVVFNPDPAGISCDNENWWGSNYGTGLDVMAPGVKISTTGLNETVTHSFNGTSAACPMAAGVMALILEANPNLTGVQAREILESTCDKVGGYNYANTAGQPNGTWHQQMGYGRINAYKAVNKALSVRYCPDYDFNINPTTNWSTHSSVIDVGMWSMYRVPIVSGYKYTFKTCCGDGSFSSFPSVMFLDNNNCMPDTNGADQIVYTANFTGTALLKIQPTGTNSGSYTLAYRREIPTTTCNLSLSQSSANVGYNAGSTTLTISANSNWSISGGCSWANVSAGSGNGNANVTVTYTGNKSLSSRQCSFTVSCGSATQTYTITQAGMPLTLSSPANGASGVACNNGVTFSWSSTVGNPRYRIKIATSSNFNTTDGLTNNIFFEQGNLTSNSITVTGLNSNTQYFWTVKVHDETNAITSEYISPRSFWTGNCIAGGGTGCTITTSAFPIAGGNVNPSGTNTYPCGSYLALSATPNPGYIFVNWTENGNAVWPNENYTFNLNNSRNLVANFTQQGSGCPLLPAPTNVTATATSPTSIFVSWNTVPGATRYRIYRCEGNFMWLIDAPATSANIIYGISPGTNYSIKVTAFNDNCGTLASSTCVSVTTPPLPQPNLRPRQLSGWSAPLVVTNTGSYTSNSTYLSTDNLSYHLAYENNGDATANSFITRVFLNNNLINTFSSCAWNSPNNCGGQFGAEAGGWEYFENWGIGSLSPGSYELRMVVDENNQISESNENDNEYVVNFTVIQALPNLKPFTPSGFSAPLVVSNVTGTFTDASTIYHTDNVYIDARLINEGNVNAGAFNTNLYLDNVLLYTFNSNSGLQGGFTTGYNDLNIGARPVGSYELRMVVDADNQVNESNEFDNVYIRTFNVVCNPPAQPSSIAGSGTVCQSSQQTYSVTNVSGVTYTWSVNGGYVLSGQGSNQVVVVFTSSGSRSLTVTPSTACNGTARTRTITVTGLPAQPSAITGNTLPCINTNYTYSVTNVTGLTYTWSVSDGVIISGQGTNSVTVRWNSAGNQSIMVVPSNNCGNGISSSLNLDVSTTSPAAPTITANGNTTICVNQSVVLTTGATGVTYQWRLNGQNISGATSQSFNASQAGTYTLQVGNSCGNNISSNSIDVVTQTALGQPTIARTGDTVFCSGGSVDFFTNYTNVTYQWIRNGQNIPGANSAVYTATQSGNYSLRVTNSCNSVVSWNSYNVVVNTPPAAPVISPNGSATICSGSSVQLQSNQSGVTYQWRLNGVSINGATQSSYTANQAGNYTLITSNNCGNSQVSNIIAVNVLTTPPQPTISANGNTLICPGQSLTLSTTATGVSFQWQLNGQNISGANQATYQATQSGEYRLLVFNSCFSSLSNPIVVNVITRNFIHTPTSNPSICSSPTINSTSCGFYFLGSVLRMHGTTNSQGVRLTISKCDGSTFSSLSSYYIKWSTSSNLDSLLCSPNSVQINPVGLSSFLFVDTNSGIQGATRYYIFTSKLNSGNDRYYSNTVTVQETTTSPLISFSPSLQLCFGDSVRLSTSYNAASYQWLLNSNPIAFATDTFLFAKQSGIYQVAANRCYDTLISNPVNVFVNPHINASANVTNSSCPNTNNGSISLNVSGGSGSKTFSWSNAATSQSVSNLSPGNYQVTITDSLNCSRSFAYTVSSNNVMPTTPSVIFGKQNVCKGQSVYSVSQISTVTTYSWSVSPNGNIVSGLGTSAIIVNWLSGNIGTVSVATSNQCGNSTPITLNISIDTNCLAVVNNQSTFRANYHLANIDIRGGITQDTDSTFVFSGTRVTTTPSGVISKLNSKGDVIWSKTYSQGTNETWLTDIKQTNTGEFIVTGNQAKKALVMKTNSVGTTIWSYTYLPESTSQSNGNKILPVSDGGFVVAGTASRVDPDGVGSILRQDSTKMFAFKIDANGNLLWMRTFFNTTSFDDNDYLSDVAEVADGYVFVGGVTMAAGNGQTDAFILKTDFNGSVQWSKRFGSTNSEHTSSIITTGSNEVAIAGSIGSSFFIRKINTSNGSVVSGASNTYLPSNALNSTVSNIIKTKDNQIAVIGEYNLFSGGVSFNSFIAKFNTVTWLSTHAKNYSSFLNVLPNGIECADSGFIFNSTVSSGTGYDFGVVKTDKTGSQVDLSCDGNSFNLTRSAYSTNFLTVNPTIFTSGSRSSALVTVSNANLTRNLFCSFQPCSTPHQPSAISGQVAVCTNTSQSYTISTVSGATSYTWSVSGGGSITSGQGTTNATINWVTTGGPYTVSVTANNNCGNSNPSSLNITVNPQAPNNAGAITGNQTVCVGNQLYSISPVAGATNYTWAVSGGGSITSGQGTTSISINWSSSGSYAVSVTASNGCGSAMNSTPVTVNANPTAAINPTTVAICNGETATLTASGGTSYAWSNGGGNNAQATFSPTTNTTYTVTVTGANGCTATATRLVTVNTNPTASITPSTVAICNGQTATLTASGGTSYAWSNGGGNNAQATFSPTINTTYTVTVTGANGCTATATRLVTVNTNPTAAISPATATICNGQTATLTASGGGTYVWSNGGGTNAQALFNPTTNTTYSVTVIGANGCTATASRLVTVNALPNAAINGPTSNCSGLQATLTASGGGTYLWSNGLGTNASVTVTPLQTTAYTVTVTNSSNCSATAIQTVSVQSSPSASIAGPSSVCDGKSIILTANGGNTYTWANGLGSNPSITVSPTSNTTYTVTVSVGSNCTATASKTVTITQSTFSVLNRTICQGGAFNFNGKVLTQAGVYKDTILNSVGCDSIITLNLTTAPALQGSFSKTICNGSSYHFNGQILTQSGVYTTTLQTADGCDSLVTLNLNVLNKIQSIVNAGICLGQSYLFNGKQLTQSGHYFDTLQTALGCDSFVTLNLSVGTFASTILNKSICQGQSFIFKGVALTQPGVYYDTLTANVGCDSIVTLNLTVLQPSYNSITAVICNNNPYNFNGNSITAPGTYTFTLVAANGCDSIVTLTLNSITTAPVSAVLNTSSTTVCPNQLVTLHVSVQNNTGNIDYQWSLNGNFIFNPSSVLAISSLQDKDSVQVTVETNDGCGNNVTLKSNTLVFNVQNGLVKPIIAYSDSVICPGDSVQLSTTQNYNSYFWSNGSNAPSIFVKTSGPHSVQVTNTCGVAISDPLFLKVSGLQKPSVFLTGTDVLNSSVTANFYQWYRNGIPLVGISQQSIVATVPANYAVEVTDSLGCSIRSDDFYLSLSSIGSIEDALTKIYPSPFDSKLFIESNQKIESITVYDKQGSVIYYSNDVKLLHTIDTQLWASGIYNVVLNQNGRIENFRVVKTN